jgi:hypothetical protein
MRVKEKMLLPLAGRGGEEWKQSYFSSSASARWWIGMRGAVSILGDPKRRLDCVVAICGQRGHSEHMQDVSGVLQQRTEAGGYHRPASASHGQKATRLYFYFPETKKSKGKIYRSCHDAGPSGSSLAPVSVLWWSNLSASSIRNGAELGGPDCFFYIFPGVSSVKAQSLSRILLICRGFSAICNRFVNTSSF